LRERNDGVEARGDPDAMSGLNPSLTIAAMLARWPETGAVLVSRRMACVGCEMNGFETIAEVAASYGLPAAELIGDLRRAVENASRRQTARPPIPSNVII
jgi:hybrid cluster-associated redox disulfide protein